MSMTFFLVPVILCLLSILCAKLRYRYASITMWCLLRNYPIVIINLYSCQVVLSTARSDWFAFGIYLSEGQRIHHCRFLEDMGTVDIDIGICELCKTGHRVVYCIILAIMLAFFQLSTDL